MKKRGPSRGGQSRGKGDREGGTRGTWSSWGTEQGPGRARWNSERAGMEKISQGGDRARGGGEAGGTEQGGTAHQAAGGTAREGGRGGEKKDRAGRSRAGGELWGSKET